MRVASVLVNEAALFDRAARNISLLRRLNVVTLCVAIVVYVGLLSIAAYNRVGPLAVFSSCIMLAEVLVFQIVRTLSDHLDLIRSTTARK